MSAPASASFRDYLELTKPRLSLLSVLTTVVGYLAARPAWDGAKFTLLLAGTSLAAGGVAALNHWLEQLPPPPPGTEYAGIELFIRLRRV